VHQRSELANERIGNHELSIAHTSMQSAAPAGGRASDVSSVWWFRMGGPARQVGAGQETSH
jgi:hypothetical protein